LGGDLDFFVNCIKNKKRKDLKDYAYKCIDLVYNYNNNYELDVFSTCVVQGNAYGGGFESALSGNYILAEETTKFSFPEVIFGTFPGMGAYSFLTKKVGFNKANKIIHSNKTFTAKEIFDLGIINEVCEEALGIATIATHTRNGELGNYIKNPFLNICGRVTKEELIAVVDVWLDKAFTLTDEDSKKC
jgi:Enoyl-CoA hydratase/carnithine racemase